MLGVATNGRDRSTMDDRPFLPTRSNQRLAELERPVGDSVDFGLWGSDAIAQTLKELGIEFIALVPGSSYRGLHDSLVNGLGNSDPQMVVCLHEEHAVAIADGYARATDRPMAAALHSNVGLMHAAMPIYNAWCDRQPMIIIGATGPVDAHERRPWIDWIHTSRDQGALVRGYVKWDDQPASTQSSVESVIRAHQIATTAPYGPTYVCLDVSVQERRLEKPVPVPPLNRFRTAAHPAAGPGAIAEVVAALKKAKRPLFLFGRVSRGREDWDARVRLVEAVGAVAMTSIHNPAAFPTDHAQHLVAPCAEKRSPEEIDIVAEADLIVSFDWMDLAGFLRSCTGEAQSEKPIETPIVSCSLDQYMANGWAMDIQALAAADISILAHPDTFVAQLLEALPQDDHASAWDFSGPHWTSHLPAGPIGDREGCISLGDFALEVRRLADDGDATFVRLPLGWPRTACRFNDPLAYLGKDGAGAVGIGPGHAVGAALALRNSGRVVTAVLGDGDTVMGINAFWTASHLDLPLLVIVGNNTSYFNDELHQQRVAVARSRPVENRWIGQRIADPEVDIVAMARAQGFDGEGPVRTAAGLREAIAKGAEIVRAGGRYLIDARIEPGYVEDFGLKQRSN